MLATELASRGATVTVIDADPNKPLSQWSKRAGKPETLTVLADVKEDSIIDAIEKAATESTFVIVDLEGMASMTVGYEGIASKTAAVSAFPFKRANRPVLTRFSS